MLHHLDGATILVANLINYNCHPLEGSLGPVVNILAIFSNANILKINKRIKIYHIKGIGCPLLILINIDAWGLRWYFPLIIRSADQSNYSLLLKCEVIKMITRHRSDNEDAIIKQLIMETPRKKRE